MELSSKLLLFKGFILRYCRNVASRTCQEVNHNFCFEFSIYNKNFNCISERKILDCIHWIYVAMKLNRILEAAFSRICMKFNRNYCLFVDVRKMCYITIL